MSLYVLDTDTFSLYMRGDAKIRDRILQTPPDQLAVSVITIEETLSGWYILLRKKKSATELVGLYRMLAETARVFGKLTILDFTVAAAETFMKLKQDITTSKIGIMDLRLASVAMEHRAVLITLNWRDFQNVPGLRWEDWSKD